MTIFQDCTELKHRIHFLHYEERKHRVQNQQKYSQLDVKTFY